MGVEVIIHDSMGEVSATLQSLKSNITDMIVTEFVYALRALIFAKEMLCIR